MRHQSRSYRYAADFGGDYNLVRDFLIGLNSKGIVEYDFDWGRWEWAHCLPFFKRERAADIALWERDGRVCAAALFEYGPGPVYPVLGWMRKQRRIRS